MTAQKTEALSREGFVDGETNFNDEQRQNAEVRIGEAVSARVIDGHFPNHFGFGEMPKPEAKPAELSPRAREFASYAFSKAQF